MCSCAVTSPSRPSRSRNRSGASAISSSASSQPSTASATNSCSSPSVAVSGPPEYSYHPASAGTFRKPCSPRKRTTSSSGLIPGSSRRKTLRMSVSPKTTEVFDCSDETSRAAPMSCPSAAKSAAGWNCDDALRPLQRVRRAHRAHELARDLDRGVGEQLVDVVRAGVVGEPDEVERQLRFNAPNDDGVEDVGVAYRLRLRAVPALLCHVLDELCAHVASSALSWNQ